MDAALWIDESARGAQAAQFTLVDLPTVLIRISRILLEAQTAAPAHSCETEKLLDRLRKQQAGLVEVVPTVLSVTDINGSCRLCFERKDFDQAPGSDPRDFWPMLAIPRRCGGPNGTRPRQQLSQSICRNSPDGRPVPRGLDAGRSG